MEPLYEYQKSKGWVQVLYPVFTMDCGTTVRVEPRFPNIGERFSWVYADDEESSWHYADKTPKLNRWVESYSEDCFNDISVCGVHDRPDDARIYVTFVKVG